MDHYRLTIYQADLGNASPSQPVWTWIELQDMEKQSSHIFSFIPTNHQGELGGCGFFRKKDTIPNDVRAAVDISLTKTAYIEMVREGNCLHKQFLLYDDGQDPSLIH